MLVFSDNVLLLKFTTLMPPDTTIGTYVLTSDPHKFKIYPIFSAMLECTLIFTHKPKCI